MRGICLLFVLAVCAFACDIIVHVKSKTDKPFVAQVTASNGKKSDKWLFEKRRVKNTFSQKADECGLSDWKIQTFENGQLRETSQVTLDGIGRVSYEVGDDLKPIMSDRQGAICKGQCAPL